MNIHVRLLFDLKQHSPTGEPEFNLDLKHATVTDLMNRLGIPITLRKVVLVNGRPAHTKQKLQDNDQVVVFLPVTGG